MQRSRRTSLLHNLAILALSASASIASAQTEVDAYPSRPVTIVIPSTPGGSAEAVLRQFLQRVSQTFVQQSIVLHRPGAGGTIGADLVAKAKPDGYTLVLGAGNFGAAPVLFKNLSYDPIKSFEPISILSTRNILLAATPTLPVNNAREYFDYARANPGKVSFGVVSNDGRLSAAHMHKLAKVNVVLIDYKGTSEMLQDLLAGRLHATIITFNSLMPLVNAKKVKPLGTASAQRSKLSPDLATISEQGAPGYQFESWVGILAPAGTPKAIVDKLSAEFAKAGQDKSLREKFEGDFMEVLAGSPEQAAAFMKAEVERWKAMEGTP